MTSQLSSESPEYQGKSKFAAKLLILALAYFAGGRLGLSIPYIDTHITLIWLPTGIAVAALMRWGNGCWPGIFIGALAVNYSVDASPLLDCSIALGNTLAPFLTAWLLRRLKFHATLDRAYDILLLVVAAAAGMLASAGSGVGSLVMFDLLPVQNAGLSWLSWWAGDFVGVLLAAPLLLNISSVEMRKLWAQRTEFMIWAAIMLATSWIVFILNSDDQGQPLQYGFMILPLVVWSAMRFGVAGSSLGVLVPTVVVSMAASLGHAPHSTAGMHNGLFLLWLFLATLALVNLLISAMQAGRNRADEALRLDNEFRKELIQALPGIFYMIDKTGRLLMWNRQLERVLHLSSEEVARSHPLDFFEGNDRVLIEENIRKTFETGETTSEAMLMAKDHIRAPYYFTGRCIVRNGEPVLIGMGVDISERKLAEQMTREAKERIEFYFNSSPNAVVISRLSDGIITDLNKAFCHLCGYTKEEAVGKTTLDVSAWVNPDDRLRFMDILQAQGHCENFEAQFRRKDGSQISGILSAGITKIHGVLHIVSSARDITEQNQIQQKSEDLVKRHQALMKSTFDGIHVMDIHGNVVEANDSFCRMLGYTQEEMSRMNVTDWDVQWSREELMGRFRSLVHMGGMLFETRHRRKDGSFIDVEVSTTGAEIEGEHYLFASSRDITERKSNDTKLQRLMNLYSVLSQCNQAIVRCTSEDELFLQVCQLAVQFGNMKMAWVGMVDELTRMAKPVFSYGTGTEYLDGIQISVNEDEPTGQGPFGTAFREGRLVWLENFSTEPRLKPWHERASRYGWSGVAALPLQRNGVVVGVFMLYSAVPDAFDEAARHLLEGMATDISYALTRFALLAERKESEDEIRIAAVTFETQEAIMITSPEAYILRVNQAFQDITGYRAADVIGKNPRMFQSGRHDAVFYREMWAALLSTGKWSGEVWDRRKNGEIYPKAMTITAVRDKDQYVTHYVAVFRDISNRKKSEQEIHQLAFYDPLTGLPNRRLLLDRLQQALAVSARNGRHGALLFLDLDHFKTINDTQGHAMGDQLLIEVARRLPTCLREGDSVARLGGDEFVVVLEDLSSDADEAATQTELVAEKIRFELDKPYVLKDFEYLSSVSIGITLFFNHQESAEDLLQHADVAMYQAKMAGRNAIRFFDPNMQTALETRAIMEGDLRRALDKQQFRMYYQIQVDNLGRSLGAEVLLRWEHPEQGLVSPMQFIPLAEETGLIVPIGLWAMQMACAQLKEWQRDSLTRDLTLSVNVSAKQFRQVDFVAQVQRALLESGAKPSHLKLELTESTVLENVEDTISKMLEIKALGVNFSLDDFGTGYSSLQYLKRLPLDQIKIDQTFVRDIASDLNDAAIVQTIIAMTEALGLNVIAEGVETEAQQEFLDNNGCHAFQGYLFSKPVPLEQFEALLNPD